MSHFVVDQQEVLYIKTSDAKVNLEDAILQGRIKYAARSCKELHEKYQVYDGTLVLLIFYLKQQLCLSDSGMLLFMQMGYTIWIHQEESFIRPSVIWPLRAADGRWWLVFMKTTWMESVLLVIAGLVSRAVTQTGLMVTGRGQTQSHSEQRKPLQVMTIRYF